MIQSPFYRPFDAVRTQDGSWWFVDHFCWGQRARSTGPKYIPTTEYWKPFRGHYWLIDGKEYSRVLSDDAWMLTDKKRTLFTDAEGFLVPHVIDRHLSTVDEVSRICERDDLISQEASALCKLFASVSGLTGAIGITGSTLLGAPIPGFSDIDLVVYGADAFQSLRRTLRQSVQLSKSIRYRDFAEAKLFYSRYSVKSLLTDEQFAAHFTDKITQGLFKDIPFTIFCVPDSLTACELATALAWIPKQGTSARFRALVLDSRHSAYTALSRYELTLLDTGQRLTLYCVDRACAEQAYDGMVVDILATSDCNGCFWVLPGEGYILRCPHLAPEDPMPPSQWS